jgi:type IV secretion system protein VirB11
MTFSAAELSPPSGYTTMRNHEDVPLLRHILSPFDKIMEDDTVEDVLMQKPNVAFVRRGSKTTRHEVDFDFLSQKGLAILAGARMGQNVGSAMPLLSCDLPGGSRLQAVLPPCVADGTVALAIRRSKAVSPTLDGLAEGGIFSGVQPLRTGHSNDVLDLIKLYYEASQATDIDSRHRAWTAFLRATMKARMTHVLCGEVGSGKSFFGMGLANEIPLTDRIVTVQDSDEWSSLPHENLVALFYSKGLQGGSAVTPNDLVEASLRLAMRWLLLQELRGAEAYSFLRARRSGHPGLTTCHAANARDVFPTLALMVRQAPAASGLDLSDVEKSLKSLIDVVVHFHRPDGRFAISEVWFRPAEELGA